ncbi:hypothetical protein A5844_000318 [Enterococcus sp. 10A9_DIV0425]|uniref:Zinc-type alcohol dehydrogenase-like protein n=1 Tax=Candidatus Enterococcus wittei TaxID=1987383 RepID=A0A2C9XPH1_9ENTE|nr:zinc-binding alcohol dehydrogenase family protein [Enterococcus sp. 10A9_DIV0425]OTP12102.1 hypothetical protein A5844_000318 [Enterococcus sp. 10A9_DIV0425]THE16078.1 zinc-binding alcohol dehydrogenase family protein [Enterococcus hirae]
MASLMKKIGFYKETKHQHLIETLVPVPKPEGNDLLVEVSAVSINPVDVKIRQTKQSEKLTVLGFDSVGYVVDKGHTVTNFQVGDRVYYAGTTQRDGSHQQYQLVDARVVAKAPTNITNEEAAALPLTSLTAYELLFEKFCLIPEKNANKGKEILVINGGGGVGSILTQLAAWSGLKVAATASPKNFWWLKKNGVDVPVDYHQPLKPQLEKMRMEQIAYIAVLYDVAPYLEEIKEIVQPLGHIGMIVHTEQPIPLSEFKNRSISFDWEYMFTKTDAGVHEESQGAILRFIADLIEKKQLHSHLTKVYSEGITAASLERAMMEVGSGKGLGKLVVSGGVSRDNT